MAPLHELRDSILRHVGRAPLVTPQSARLGLKFIVERSTTGEPSRRRCEGWTRRRLRQRVSIQPRVQACVWLSTGSGRSPTSRVGAPATESPADRGSALTKRGSRDERASFMRVVHGSPLSLVACSTNRGGHLPADGSPRGDADAHAIGCVDPPFFGRIVQEIGMSVLRLRRPPAYLQRRREGDP